MNEALRFIAYDLTAAILDEKALTYVDNKDLFDAIINLDQHVSYDTAISFWQFEGLSPADKRSVAAYTCELCKGLRGGVRGRKA